MRLLLFCLILVSCSHSHHGHNKANIHMHKKDHKDLILSFSDPARDHWQRPQRVLELIGPLKGKKVIDIGSGSDYFTNYFLKDKALVVAGDVDQKFLRHIEQSFPQKEFPHLSILPIEYDDPKMTDSTYDLAFTSNTYHHIENRVEYLKKVRKGLKTGGRFVALDFKVNPPSGKIIGPPLSMRVSETTVVKELLEAGFDHLEIYANEFEYQYLVIGKKTHE